MEEIKRFRQIDSKTPGHPESHITSGVETTTGPLGQGREIAWGWPLPQMAGGKFQSPSFEIFNFNTYAICGDGDLMEGVASEAASLAGHLKLSNLCWIYDNNHVTLDGPAEWSFSEDVMARFAAMAGTSRTSRTQTIWTCWPVATKIFSNRKTGRRSSWWIATSGTDRRTSRIPTKHMASRWARRKSNS